MSAEVLPPAGPHLDGALVAYGGLLYLCALAPDMRWYWFVQYKGEGVMRVGY
jgi:hypothetical protein